MEISEVKDRESLEAYLDDISDEDARLLTARRVAYLSAMRVAPFALGYFARRPKRGNATLTALPVLAGLAYSGVASTCPTPEYDAAAARAANAATAATATAAAARAPRADIWNVVRTDLRVMQVPPKGDIPSIWPEGPPDWFNREWKAAQSALKSNKGDDDQPIWTFWITWYERALAGKNLYPEKLAPILDQFSKDDWLGDPANVNPEFDPILELYEADDLRELEKATPQGEIVVYDPPKDVLVLRPTDMVAPNYLSNVTEQIASAARLFGDIGEGNSPYAMLRDELRILADTQTRHADRPVLILKDVSRVLRRLDRRIEDLECPTPKADVNVEDFQEILVQVQLDLIALSPEVKEYHQATKPLVAQETLEEIASAAELAKKTGNQELAEALQESADILRNPNATDEEKRSFFYSITSRLSRMYGVARKSLKETADVTGDAAKIGRNLLFLASSPEILRAIRLMIDAFK